MAEQQQYPTPPDTPEANARARAEGQTITFEQAGRQYPTREQIAEALYLDNADHEDWSWATEDNPLTRASYLKNADAVFALFPQPTPSAEPLATCLHGHDAATVAGCCPRCGVQRFDPRGQQAAESEDEVGVEPLTSEQASEQMYLHMVRSTPAAECGKVMPHDPHLWATEATLIPWESRRCSGTGTEQGRRMAAYDADPPSIADMAPGTTFVAEGRDGTDRFCAVANLDHTIADLDDCVFRADDWFDPSTIRDVTPPPATPEATS